MLDFFLIFILFSSILIKIPKFTSFPSALKMMIGLVELIGRFPGRMKLEGDGGKLSNSGDRGKKNLEKNGFENQF